MIEIYNYNQYYSYKIDPEVFIENVTPGLEVKHSFRHLWNRVAYMILPFAKQQEEFPIKDEWSCMKSLDLSVLLNKVEDFSTEDSVYIHPNCTIPRAKVIQKYKRVLKPEKADVCIVPSDSTALVEPVIILFNKDTEMIYFARQSETRVTLKDLDIKIGMTPVQINPTLENTKIQEKSYYTDNNHNPFRMEVWKSFLKSEVIYIGDAFILEKEEYWKADLIYHKIHDVITDRVLLSHLEEKDGELSLDNTDGLTDLLWSKDVQTALIGLKSLAEMNYQKYRSTAQYLINECPCLHLINKSKLGASVRFMIDTLKSYRKVTGGVPTPVNQEDANIVATLIKRKWDNMLSKYTDNFMSLYPFIELNLHYQTDFKIKPLENEKKQFDTSIID